MLARTSSLLLDCSIYFGRDLSAHVEASFLRERENEPISLEKEEVTPLNCQINQISFLYGERIGGT